MSRKLVLIKMLSSIGACVLVLSGLTGCSVVDSSGPEASKAEKLIEAIGNKLSNAKSASDVKISSTSAKTISSYESDLRGTSTLTPAERSALAKIEDFQIYKVSVSDENAIVVQLNANSSTTSANLVGESEYARLVVLPSASLTQSLEGATAQVTKATTCALADDLLKGSDAAPQGALRLAYDPALVIPQTVTPEIVYAALARVIGGSDVQALEVSFSLVDLGKNVYNEAQGTVSSITQIQQAKNPLTPAGWVFYWRYCVVQ